MAPRKSPPGQDGLSLRDWAVIGAKIILAGLLAFAIASAGTSIF